MIIVTGGAGFIGSNIVHQLNQQGERDILVVDNLKNGPKFLNLQGAQFSDYMDKAEFRSAVARHDSALETTRAILHQGACSNTLEDDGAYMMDNNFNYSKELLYYAQQHSLPFVYASTAAVYGLSRQFAPEPENEQPLNVYGFSKLTFDNCVRRLMPQLHGTVVGLRYFNVYGPREAHKGRMSSVIHHFTRQLRESGVIRMFQGSGGYGDGEQQRDFVFVNDLARINFFFAGLAPGSVGPYKGIVNAGTGAARTFKDVAQALFSVHGPGTVEFIPFPADLASRYQHFTQADVSGLRRLGYQEPFTSLETGVRETFTA